MYVISGNWNKNWTDISSAVFLKMTFCQLLIENDEKDKVLLRQKSPASSVAQLVDLKISFSFQMITDFLTVGPKSVWTWVYLFPSNQLKLKTMHWSVGVGYLFLVLPTLSNNCCCTISWSHYFKFQTPGGKRLHHVSRAQPLIR